MTEVRIIPSTDPRLGRVVEHDPRSRHFAFVAKADVPLVSKRWTRNIPVFDQGSIGSCTGNTAVGGLGTSPFYETLSSLGIQFVQDTAVDVYSAATVVDGFPGTYTPDDTGSSGLAVAKVLQSRGWISGYQHTFSFGDMAAALQKGPVFVGINWYNNFFNPNVDGEITILETDYVAGGHEVLCDEIDMERQRFGFTNSWGEYWGKEGRFYVSFDLMKRLLKEDGDVVVPVPLTAPEPVPTPEPYSVDSALWHEVESWSKARHSGCNRKAAKSVTTWAKAKGLTV